MKTTAAVILFMAVSVAATAQRKQTGDPIYDTPYQNEKQISGQDNIPKKANTILITDSLKYSFREVAGIVVDLGYGILNADESLGIITTTDRAYKFGSVKVLLVIKENSVQVKGEYLVPVSLNFGYASAEASWSRIEFMGMKNSPALSAWNEIKKLSDQIHGKKEYLIK